ncbi:glycoside hydrolase family 3 C-terminal domain-containing protein [Alicyclobacillus vulcanalis]|uniref:Beta-glucosidase n=1 Tax=Alicyclobacillus vulcanalis TaxID=252246 RepID=A0A1N7P3C8_9BACL|nr:glycoside hydrolase family 3 C-terminal domain-containing protein [Alicyclobacillus vulcanalis]SIT05091.1 beta-glucosidase [Alicyclobacillus vulcanalis]
MAYRDLVSQLTLEEKASLCSGLNFWQTQPIERLGIPALCLTDGPHGVRLQRQGGGVFDSEPATCFPTSAALASTWNPALVERVGEALGDECRSLGVHVLLGPGANIKRSPLCGRNFEYFSEDPLLSGQMAAAHIRGVQSRGVGTSLKHFAANNQEYRRLTTDARVDERALREIYLASFEGAVQGGRPWTVMCAYNRLNGTYCSEHPWLLTEVLRRQWGFDGIVVSDWGAVNDRVRALAAGLDLEMPGGPYAQDADIVRAVREGRLDEAQLDETVTRLLELVDRAYRPRADEPIDVEGHHRLAREVAGEAMVLLKNDGSVLPVAPGSRVAVIGAFAEHPRYQGGGSSHVTPTRLDIPLHELKRAFGEESVTYAPGYALDDDEPRADLIEEAARIAAEADAAIVFAGLPESWESEGYDRPHMRMPDAHVQLIEAIAARQPNVIVVLSNGAPVEMPWISKVPAVIEAYLAGQAFGGAIADVLSGAVNPSGKLAETFPIRLEHNPSHPFFPGEGDRVEYREGVFVGYRYYDTKEMDVLFPFGHGLSYTTFTYENLRASTGRMRDDEVLVVQVDVRNTGPRFGKEVVQLYVEPGSPRTIRPRRELRAFAKVALHPGEVQTVEFQLGKRAFSHYDEEAQDFVVESGPYLIRVGASSRDLRLEARVEVESTAPRRPIAVHANALLGDLLADPVTGPVLRALMQERLAGSPLGADIESNPTLEAFMKFTPIGRLTTLFGVPRDEIEQVMERLREAQAAASGGEDSE